LWKNLINKETHNTLYGKNLIKQENTRVAHQNQLGIKNPTAKNPS
jgi:hypothetical protein